MGFFGRSVKKVDRCKHDWHYAGPTKMLREILQEIPGLETARDVTCGHREFTVKVLGEIYNYTTLMYNGPLQGEVCLECGECQDVIADKVREWTKIVEETRTRQQLAAAKKELAEKLWKECPKHG